MPRTRKISEPEAADAGAIPLAIPPPPSRLRIAAKPPRGTGHRKRLRERFERSGGRDFHDYEVLELLLMYAIPRRDVKPSAKGLLSRFKTLSAVFAAPLHELAEIEGLGTGSAILLKAAHEAISRALLEAVKADGEPLSSLDSVKRFCRHNLSDLSSEKFQVIFLNSKNRVVGVETVQEGTIDHAVVYPRNVIASALRHRAAALIFVHNHPSGDPHPSEADRRLTLDLCLAASGVDIRVHDHLIIAGPRNFSFRENGLMP